MKAILLTLALLLTLSSCAKSDEPALTEPVRETLSTVSPAQVMELAELLTPDIRHIAVLYNPGDGDAAADAADFTLWAAENGFEVSEGGYTESGDAAAAVRSLSGKVDAVYCAGTTDPELLTELTGSALAESLPVYSKGGTAPDSGALAGVSAESVTGSGIWIVNMGTAEQLGITIPENVLTAARLIAAP